MNPGAPPLIKVKDGIAYSVEQERRFRDLMGRFAKEKDALLQKEVDDKIPKPTSIFTQVMTRGGEQTEKARSRSVIHSHTQNTPHGGVMPMR